MTASFDSFDKTQDKSAQDKRGFTLIELLVAISIIAILSVVGFVSYQNVSSKAKDAKMKADINAIRKAYETNYDPSLNGGQGGYKPLSDAQFASGKIPTSPGGESYMAYFGPNSTDGTNSLPGQTAETHSAYKVCATLSNNTSTCATSTQGDTSLFTPNYLPNPSCDPTGSLASGLVAYWKMDDNIVDYSGLGNNGIWGSAGSHYTDTGGKPGFGKAADFDGIDDYISVPYSSSLPNWGAMSISFWVNPDDTDGGGLISASYDDRGWLIYLNSSGTFTFDPRYANGNYSKYHKTTASSASGWTFITVNYDGGDIRIYFNGNIQNTNPTAEMYNGGLPLGSKGLLIGKKNQGGDYYKGLIDDIRIYNRPIFGEIATLYNNGSGCI